MNGTERRTEGEVRRRCAKLTLIVTLSVRVRTRNRERMVSVRRMIYGSITSMVAEDTS
jgi:hypothetical protein